MRNRVRGVDGRSVTRNWGSSALPPSPPDDGRRGAGKVLRARSRSARSEMGRLGEP
jgi:hypothetical protein